MEDEARRVLRRRRVRRRATRGSTASSTCATTGRSTRCACPFASRDDGTVDVAESNERFHGLHERAYTFRLDSAIEIVNFHVVGSVPTAQTGADVVRRRAAATAR